MLWVFGSGAFVDDVVSVDWCLKHVILNVWTPCCCCCCYYWLDLQVLYHQLAEKWPKNCDHVFLEQVLNIDGNIYKWITDYFSWHVLACPNNCMFSEPLEALFQVWEINHDDVIRVFIGLRMEIFICLCVSVLRWTGQLFRVSPCTASCPVL